MSLFLDLLYFLAVIAYSPVIIYRAVRHKRYRLGWSQRFGKISRSSSEKCIWLHAVSLGEINAARTVIEQINDEFPDLQIVISTTTDTGYDRAQNLFGAKHKVIFFPFDFSFVMKRAFAGIRPSVCLLMELEVWPNFVETAQRNNVPVIVVNGRISRKSLSRYTIIKPLVKKVFSKVSLVLAQSGDYACRFRELGVPTDKVLVTGSLKYDTSQIADNIAGADIIKASLGLKDERLWVAGGTGPGEEKIILDVFRQIKNNEQFGELRLVVVPRKPERFDEVAALIEQAGFDFIRYSHFKEHPEKQLKDKPPVILGDTMGDLRKFYSLSSLIFVGRSLVPMGGSDMMEAAALGKCTIFGPHTFNFSQTVQALLAGNGAIEVQDQQQLFQTMQKCLLEPAFAEEIATNGREVIRKNQGATKKTIEQISKYLSL